VHRREGLRRAGQIVSANLARAKTLKSLSFAVDFSKVQLCVLPGSLEDRHHLTGLFQRLIAGVIVLGGEEGAMSDTS